MSGLFGSPKESRPESAMDSEYVPDPTRKKTFIKDYKMTHETRELLKLETIKNFKNSLKNKVMR